jgi:hypothetical protein
MYKYAEGKCRYMQEKTTDTDVNYTDIYRKKVPVLKPWLTKVSIDLSTNSIIKEK